MSIPDTDIKFDKSLLEEVIINGEPFYKISQVDRMRPFFMSIVSDSDHWLFISSNGGITAGRKDTDRALFPYYTDDKLAETAETTGSKTIVRVSRDAGMVCWEPFSIRGEGTFTITRNLYQNRYTNKIIFEEINHDLALRFQYEWNTSSQFGFVKKSELQNLSEETVEAVILDGLQNIMPHGVPADLQTKTSNLADAYKRSELVPGTGMGLFALSAVIVDKAEPSEALKANVAWCSGLADPLYLLSGLQLQAFRQGKKVMQEEDIKGEKGSYFVVCKMVLGPAEKKSWTMMANVNQDHADVVSLCEAIQTDPDLVRKVERDIRLGTENLVRLCASSDALQISADDLKDSRHFSNVLFNIMRGGIFDCNYQIEKSDFVTYLQKASKSVFSKVKARLQELPATFTLFDLKEKAELFGEPGFSRLATAYLPLKFSRRHGDPSRPWNQFSINMRSETDGSRILDYQGNWRDIFQNWEALAHSYPAFIEGMIYKFLNASTFDGYNPYRVTKDGFDWETIEPDNPWSYIGYWGDHQVIYLLKFLEFAEGLQSGTIAKLLDRNEFVYADVPYRIKAYRDIVANPKDTIEFDHAGEKDLLQRVKESGADGALLTARNGEIYQVNFLEKILAVLLSKLSNLVPEGGIWMNTQRPEWNDANNALVGNGLSMVTLYYLRRALRFLQPVLGSGNTPDILISSEMHVFFTEQLSVFTRYKTMLNAALDAKARKEITDLLGESASRYRIKVYREKFSGDKERITGRDLNEFIATAILFLDHSIRANKRDDGLYHAYNLLRYEEQGITVTSLSEMLEGQVGVLSSGFLSEGEALSLLDALKQSTLYREDQDSYLLYPAKNLKGFLQKNNIPEEAIRKSALLSRLAENHHPAILKKDVKGVYHFNGNFRNAGDLLSALNNLGDPYQELVAFEKQQILDLFENIFNHREFTGRSGTFFAYEGLGSIYWHMVSKLQLAVQETCIRAWKESRDTQTIKGLIGHYYAINAGIGVHKSPLLYGAFPVTPYSHTPLHKGAQQPGMTGQVKEDILCRIGELGLFIENGRLKFRPSLLKRQEFLPEAKEFECVAVDGTKQVLNVQGKSLCFTYCQVPVIYIASEQNGIEVERQDGTIGKYKETVLSEADTAAITKRTGFVKLIKVYLPEHQLI